MLAPIEPSNSAAHAGVVLRLQGGGHRDLRLIERLAPIAGRPDGGDEIGEVVAEEREVGARLDRAVAADDVVELQLAERVERRHPLGRIAVAHVRHPAVQQIAGRDHPFLRQPRHDVAVRVPATEEQQHDPTVAAVDDQRLVEGEIRQRQLEALDLREVVLLLGDLVLQARLGRRVRRLRQLRLEVGDLAGRVGELVLQARAAERAQVLARRLRGHDRDLLREGHGIGMVALRVIPVEVRVDREAHRLVGDRADLRDQRLRARRPRVGVDHQDRVVEHHHRGVAVDRRPRLGQGGVDAVGDLLQIEQLLGPRGDRDCRAQRRAGERLSHTHHAGPPGDCDAGTVAQCRGRPMPLARRPVHGTPSA